MNIVKYRHRDTGQPAVVTCRQLTRHAMFRPPKGPARPMVLMADIAMFRRGFVRANTYRAPGNLKPKLSVVAVTNALRSPR